MSTSHENNVRYRLQRLEEDVRDLQRGQPAVIAERVTRLSGDIENLRRDFDESIDGVRRLLFTFFTGLGIAIIAAIIALVIAGGHP